MEKGSDDKQRIEDKKQIVQVLTDSIISGAGFLISAEGYIATCYHNITNHSYKKITVKFPFTEFPNEIFSASIENTDAENDILILKIANYDQHLAPLQLQTSFHANGESIYTCGFPIDDFPPVTAKGEILDSNISANGNRRIQFRSKEVEKGFSGAPVILKSSGKSIGMIAKIITPDKSMRNLETVFAIPSEYIKELFPTSVFFNEKTLLANEIDRHNSAQIRELKRIGIYQPEVFYRREISDVIDAFIVADEPVLLISGESGIGKTNAVLKFVETCQPNAEALYFNCGKYQELNLNEIVGLIFYKRKLETTPALSAILLWMEENSNGALVVIFDGLEGLKSIDLQNFENLLKEIEDYTEKSPARLIKIILTINRDYLNEKLPVLTAGTYPQLEPLNFNLFYTNANNLPFFEIKRFAITPNPGSELETVYELYRDHKFITFNNKKTGIRPKSTYGNLSEMILMLIAHPFTLRNFLILYHDKEIPGSICGVDIYSRLIEYLYKAIPEFSGTLKRSLNTILAAIADEIYFKWVKDFKSAVTNNQSNSVDERNLIITILQHTSFLTETDIKYNPFNEKRIAFSSDWYFEYFLYLSIYRKLTHVGSLTERMTIMNRYLEREQNAYVYLFRALTILGERIIIQGDTIEKELIFDIINNKLNLIQNQLFTNLFFDAIRTNYSFQKIEIKDLLSGKYIDGNGADSILNYIGTLENEGHYADALVLLFENDFWGHFTGDAVIKNKRLISISFSLFHSHRVDEALLNLDTANISILGDNKAKFNFIKGRCLQFQQKYEDAIAIYTLSSDAATVYGFRCAHQIAFSEMMISSDFKIVGNMLADLDNKGANNLPLEDRLITKVLYATCLFRTDRHLEAERILREVIALRKKTRNRHKSGIALRTLAELHLTQFDPDKSMKTIEESIDELEDGSYYLSLAHSLDIKAQVISIFYGDFERVKELMERIIELCNKAEAKKNAAAISWSYQSYAFIFGLRGNIEAMTYWLDKSEAIFSTPFQKLRREFTVVLANALIDKCFAGNNKKLIKKLVADFKSKSIGWYPFIMELLITDKKNAGKIVNENLNREGLVNSFLFHQIFQN